MLYFYGVVQQINVKKNMNMNLNMLFTRQCSSDKKINITPLTTFTTLQDKIPLQLTLLISEMPQEEVAMIIPADGLFSPFFNLLGITLTNNSCIL
jgi:hypothetical protein